MANQKTITYLQISLSDARIHKKATTTWIDLRSDQLLEEISPRVVIAGLVRDISLWSNP